MGWKEVNIRKYVAEVKRNMKISISDEIVEKDLLLTFILAEFEKLGLGKELVFKGGTLLSRNYLRYHRFSEDLDFVHKDSNILRELPRAERERRVKRFIDSFAPRLKEAADTLGLDFRTDRSDTRYCSILHGRAVYTFRVYYSRTQHIKIEVNFVEKMVDRPQETPVNAITDFFDSRGLMFALGLSYRNFRVPSYSLKEIVLEKYRAVLTRDIPQERDLFDLFLIKGSLGADIDEIAEKIRGSFLAKRGLDRLVAEKLALLEDGAFFRSDVSMKELAIIEYDAGEFEDFKRKIRPILIEVCRRVAGTPAES